MYLYIDSEDFLSVDFWKRGLPQPPNAGGFRHLDDILSPCVVSGGV